ncbi:MAG: tetratricopeptide repeat protein [Thermoanaerobaculia bacterium]
MLVMQDGLSAEDVARHDAAYKEAWRLIRNEILLDGRGLRAPKWLIRRRLHEAIGLFETALEINPSGWQSMWGLGKIYQRLGDHEKALDWFLKARLLESSNPDVAREASISALALGKAEESLVLTEAALAANPRDTGLLANRALALMIAGQLSDARTLAAEAVSRNPKDRASRNALRLVEDVAAGKRRRPTRVPAA